MATNHPVQMIFHLDGKPVGDDAPAQWPPPPRCNLDDKGGVCACVNAPDCALRVTR